MNEQQTLLQKGFEQAYELDKSLLTLSAGALALSLTFVGNLSDARHCLLHYSRSHKAVIRVYE
jgi:hypothetical protein